MAEVIFSDNRKQEVTPLNKKYFQMEEVYRLLECDMVQLIPADDGQILLADEDGKHKCLPENWEASALARNYLHSDDVLVGTVLHCPRSMFR